MIRLQALQRRAHAELLPISGTMICIGRRILIAETLRRPLATRLKSISRPHQGAVPTVCEGARGKEL